VMLTHHSLKPLGQRKLPLGSGAPLPPITSAGTGSVHEKQKIWLRELIEKVNDLFDADVTESDKLVYVNNVLKGKLMESETLQQQARNNTKEQFASSPDLQSELTNAIIAALDAHNLMSSQALNSPKVQDGLKKILLDHANLYEDLKAVPASV
jgi:type I restriction enzyme, R subunit